MELKKNNVFVFVYLNFEFYLYSKIPDYESLVIIYEINNLRQKFVVFNLAIMVIF